MLFKGNKKRGTAMEKKDDKPRKSFFEHWRFSYNAPVTLTFIFICAAVFLLEALFPNLVMQSAFTCYRTNFGDPMQYIRLFTHVLGHKNWDHFFGNITLILLIGPIVEEKYRSLKLLLIIIITAGITGLYYVIFTPDTGLLGASGIALMLVLLGSCANFSVKRIPITMILVLVCYIGKDIAALFAKEKSGVANMAHVLGAVLGAAYGLFEVNHAKKNAPIPPPAAAPAASPPPPQTYSAPRSGERIINDDDEADHGYRRPSRKEQRKNDYNINRFG